MGSQGWRAAYSYFLFINSWYSIRRAWLILQDLICGASASEGGDHPGGWKDRGEDRLSGSPYSQRSSQSGSGAISSSIPKISSA